MTLPSTSLPSHPKSALLPKRKRANTAKRRRGGQPGNQNARKLGVFSLHKPGPLSEIRLRVSALERSYVSGMHSPDEILEQSTSLLDQLQSDESLTAALLQIKIIRLMGRVNSAYLPMLLRQRALETIAQDPFGFIERGYKDWGISRDADSFFPVSKLSARNSPLTSGQLLLPSPNGPIGGSRSIPEHSGGRAGGGVAGGLPPSHPFLATNLTDEQWAILAPLIPPDPWGDWLTGEPPILIAANRWGFTLYTPTGEFNDFVIMQNYHQELQRFPALLVPWQAPSRPAKKRGRPRNEPASPRALLDAIFWKLATGHNWDALPQDFPPMPLCRKYYRRLFLSGRLYTLLLALYNHMRLEAAIDPYLLLEQGLFTTTPSQNIALSPEAPATWQNYTALLFMQLARDAYLRMERETKRANPRHLLMPVLKGFAPHSTGRIPGLEHQQLIPTFEPLEIGPAAKKWKQIEKREKIIKARVRAANRKDARDQ